MGKTVLITGGAGFIGSHLTKKLLDKNYRVISIDNLSSYYNPKIKIRNISTFKNHENYLFSKTSILDIVRLKKLINNTKINIVVHLAAQPGTRLSFIKPLIYEKNNVAGTYQILGLCKDIKPEKFIFASSSSVYGNSPTPFNEEKTTVKPLSLYGATKLAGEHACFTYHKNFNISMAILRFFSVYGPGGRPDMAPYIFSKAAYSDKTVDIFGDGSSSRDWTYINDITKGIYKVIKKRLSFEIINLGSNKPITLNRMISSIEKNSGKKLKIQTVNFRKDEPLSTYADINKAKRLLNWKPKTNFDQGIKLFINSFLNN